MVYKDQTIDADKAVETGQLCACFNLRKASRAITQIYDEIISRAGLRSTQFTLLMAIKAMGPVPVKRLAKTIMMDRTTLSRNLRPLEKRRLVTISPGVDRRERNLALTEEGHKLLNRAYPLWKEAQKMVSEHLGEERLNRLLSELSAVSEARAAQDFS